MNNRHKIVAGLREAISHAKGAPVQARITRYKVPDNIDVKKLREGLEYESAGVCASVWFQSRDASPMGARSPLS